MMETQTTFKALSTTIQNRFFRTFPEKSQYLITKNPKVRIVIVEEERGKS